jgi:hypothetical protein
LIGGRLAALGNVVIRDKGYLGELSGSVAPTWLSLEGASNQVVNATSTSSGYIPSLLIASSATVTFQGTPIVSANYEYRYGTVDFSGATLKFNDPVGCNSSWTIDPGSVLYSNVVFGDVSFCSSIERTIVGGNVMRVGGTLLLASSGATSRLTGGTIQAQSGVSIQNSAYKVTTSFDVSGNWLSTASQPFVAIGGTVTFTGGSSHSISGTNTFFNLTMDDSGASSPDTLTFQSSTTQTINGILSLRGGSLSSVLSIVASSNGTPASLKVSTQTMGGFLHVQDNLPDHVLHTGMSSNLGSNTGSWLTP